MYSYLFQSWDSLARNLFVYESQFNTNPFIDWTAGRSVLKVTIAIIVLTASVAVLCRQTKMGTERRHQAFVAVPALAMMVILPASATYHFILLLLPLSVLLRDGLMDKRSQVIAIAIYSAIGFIPYGLMFSLAEHVGHLFAYPRLWLVTLLFGFVCWVFIRQPKRPVTS
jgi:hypothetical protein